ncbi:alpha/beta fold hydrolase [Williamsia maris]
MNPSSPPAATRVTNRGVVYQRRGTGRPLVLIHGLGSHKGVWTPIIDALALERDVIAIDLPGFGASAAVGAGTVDQLTDHVADFLTDIGIDSPEVAGNSMGGAIALELGCRGVASRVTAFSPIGFWNRAELLWCQLATQTLRSSFVHLPGLSTAMLTHQPGRQLLRLMFAHPHRIPPTQLAADLEAVQRAAGFADAVASFAGYTLSDHTALRAIPVTIAWGRRDILLTHRTQSRRAAAALPTARHVTIDSAGHVPFADNPATCVALLTDPPHSSQTSAPPDRVSGSGPR